MATLAKTTMDSATMEGDASQSQKITEFAVLLMCWHMRQSMLAYQTYLKNLLSPPQPSSLELMIYFPNTMPPWLEDEDEEDEFYD